MHSALSVGTSHNDIYTETGFVPLTERRKRHKLYLMYKIVHNLTPKYLSDLIPTKTHIHNLRNSENLQEYPFKTDLFSKLFMPSSIREWNKLEIHTRNLPSFSSFKKQLSHHDVSVPTYYYFGKRKNQILHSKLRLKCSNLNGHLRDSPVCTCGHSFEDPDHFLLHCPLYANIRNLTIHHLESQYINVLTLLFGSNQVSLETNIKIFTQVHKYLESSKRFLF